MRKALLLPVIAGMLSHAAAQDTITYVENSQAHWVLGMSDSLNTSSDTLTLQSVQGYLFQFTPCGQSGATGPSQAAVTAAYAGTDLAGQVTVSAGIQQWQVPEGGLYRILAAGAGHNADTFIRGAVLQADFEFAKATNMLVLPGQVGDSPRGGNGGSFLTLSDSTPVLIAGGAAGMRSYVDAANRGSTATSGQSVSGPGCSAAGGTAGQGGQALNGGSCSGAGGGLLGDGQGCGGGLAFIHGGTGGNATGSYVGGFGSGGGVNSASSPGGGGGYSGGGVHYTGGGSSCAGGGGSFVMASASNLATSDGMYDNNAMFNGAPVATLGYWQIGGGTVTAAATRYVTTGVRTSPVHDVSTPQGINLSSVISWEADTFAGTGVLVETRHSTDGGMNWSAWAPAVKNGAVPGLLTGTAMDDARLQTRMTLATTALFASPRLYSVSVTVVNDSTASGLAYPADAPGDIAVFPNPFDEAITVAVTLPRPDAIRWRLHNLAGQTVQQGEWMHDGAGLQTLVIRPDIATRACGVYGLEIVTSDQTFRKKLVRR